MAQDTVKTTGWDVASQLISSGLAAFTSHTQNKNASLQYKIASTNAAAPLPIGAGPALGPVLAGVFVVAALGFGAWALFFRK